jgi:hypothetical protein
MVTQRVNLLETVAQGKHLLFPAANFTMPAVVADLTTAITVQPIGATEALVEEELAQQQYREAALRLLPLALPIEVAVEVAVMVTPA